MVLINTDITNSHTLSFAGTNPPQGSVNVRQLAPSGLNDMNEAHSGEATNRVQASVAIKTSRLTAIESINLPPHSATAIDYTIKGSSARSTRK
jgi:hypothetical protein